jgi:hypothetical protein
MKGLKFVLTLSVAFISLGLSAQQSPFPPLKQNEAAKTLIQRDIDRKLDLYQMAVDFLNEPTQIKATTEYALTSAFLNHEVKWNNLSDSDAFMKYRIRQWSKEFQELINLVKI